MKYYASIGDTDYEIRFEEKRDELWVQLNDRLVRLDVTGGHAVGFLSIILNGVSYDVTAEKLDDRYYVTIQGEAYSVLVEDERTRQLKAVGGGRKQQAGGVVKSVMPGLITQVLVAEGDAVEVDAPLAIMEAMKMENEVRAPFAGVVKRVAVKPGASVASGQELFVIEGTPE